MDEAELAVVVAGLHLVEQRRVDFCPERFTGMFGDDNVETSVVALHRKLDRGVVGLDLPADDIARDFACDGEDLVTGLKPRPSGG